MGRQGDGQASWGYMGGSSGCPWGRGKGLKLGMPGLPVGNQGGKAGDNLFIRVSKWLGSPLLGDPRDAPKNNKIIKNELEAGLAPV